MTISDFFRTTVARLKAATPPYFKTLRTWFKSAGAIALGLVTACDAAPGMMTALEHLHIYTVCQYVVASSIVGTVLSSLPVADPVVVVTPSK